MDQLAQLEEQQREMGEETSSSGTELDMLASLEQGASPYVLTAESLVVVCALTKSTPIVPPFWGQRRHEDIVVILRGGL